MAKNIIIVESPAKARTIERYLGRGYKVAASMGHVRDLPKSKLGVDIEDDFQPKYVTIRGKGKILDELRGLVKSADNVYLAMDPDREGEAIAWHLTHALNLDDGDAIRIAFNEITERVIKRSVEQPRSIKQPLVDAQQARRILDRLVGYKISPLLWRKIRYGLSAGRVQSSAVRMIVDREREREAFVPREYWTLGAVFETQANEQFEGQLSKWRESEPDIPDKATMDQVLEGLPRDRYQVAKVETKKTKRYPSAAFTTSSLQQEASRRLGMRASSTMRTAQQLYEGLPISGKSEHTGLITYMRTDASRVSEEAVDEAKAYIKEMYGAKYSDPRKQRGKAKAASQDAHEAIRPTDVTLTPGRIKKDLNRSQFRLYKLIWERFLASQMKPARFDETTLTLQSDDYEFEARGKIMRFPGFMVLSNKGQPEDDELLPEVKKDDDVTLVEFMPKQNFTKPKARYTEASLVRALEDAGIGRPSTYAPIIETIQKRGYVEIESKHFQPTELGLLVNDLLENYFADIVDLNFTASVEKRLDAIEEGKLEWRQVVREFWESLAADLERAEDEIEDAPNPICEECGKEMEIKQGRFGKFFACTGYPECRNTKPLEEQNNQETEEETDEVCEKCGRRMVIKHGRYGKFIACPGYPECQNTKPYVVKTGAECPECGGEVVKRWSKKGRVFYGCDQFPDCRFVVWNKPTDQHCEDCGAFLVNKRSKKKGEYLKCSNDQCGREYLPAEGLEST